MQLSLRRSSDLRLSDNVEVKLEGYTEMLVMKLEVVMFEKLNYKLDMMNFVLSTEAISINVSEVESV